MNDFLLFFLYLTEKLGVTAEAVQHGVEGLMYLMTESSKLLVSSYSRVYSKIII